MATRFVRVDLSEEARDYRPIAVEPGVPMLDRAGANNRIVFRWLGGMVAEPFWEDDLVGYYVRDDKGGRLEEVYCQPATTQDLQGGLRDELAKLRQRIEQARGETPTERTLRKVLMKSFQDVVDNPGRTDHDSYFFKYKDVLGNWRLIWCWGYERLDQEPAPAVVCTDTDCNLLFVRRPGKSPKCPACSGTIVIRKKKKIKREHAWALLLLLLLLLLGGLFWWKPWQSKLIASPPEYADNVGKKFKPEFTAKSFFKKKDVTDQVIGVSDDPKIAVYDRQTKTIRLTGVGKTEIEFHEVGNRDRKTVIVVTANAVPDPDKVVSLELEPAGPIDLPLGQMARLQAYANLEDGRRVQVPSERLTWKSEEKVPGLELYNDAEVVGAVGATKVGAGPLNVYALYHDKKATSESGVEMESNHVAVKGVEADPNVKLAIDVDRTLRIAGEGGQAVLTGSTPSGDVELIPSIAKFESANDKVLKFNDKKVAGKFATMLPGRSVVTGSHIAAKEPAKLEFQVCDPKTAKLVFDPADVTLPVNQTTPLRLMLEGQVADGGKTETKRAELVGPNVSYAVSQPTAVHYHPPLLTGVAASNGPFDIVGALFSLNTRAKVTIVDTPAKAIRITSSTPSPLAPWQQATLKVEQQVEGSDAWQEVRPDAVNWDDVPKTVTWTPPTETLRPTVTLPPDLQGEAHLTAKLGNLSASISLAVDPKKQQDLTGAQLVLDREPGGSFLPVGQSQRYTILVEKDGHSEPAVDVHWPSNFENDYVKWEAPVLTAKSAGYTQFVRAEVGGRTVLWHTTTYQPPIIDGEDHETKRPDWIKIFSQQPSGATQSVRFPVGATFTDFKVEVHYPPPDDYVKFVTKKAFLKTPDASANALLTADHGKLIGLRPGKTKVDAEFQGIVSKEPLEVEVLADVDIDRIAIEPANPTLRPGESYDLHAIGYKNGQSVGDITGLGNLTWTSADPNVARIAGNSVIASSVGSTQVTVERKGLKGTAQVAVSTTPDGELKVVPGNFDMALGQSMQFGSDIQVYRGTLDVSQQANVVVEGSTTNPVVAFDPATRRLVAKNVGEAPIGVTVGDKVAHALVRVGAPPIAMQNGKLVIEPGSLLLAPGQAERLTVSIETENGEKIDRTGSAIFKVADPSIASIDDGIARVKALKEGKTTVLVNIAGMPIASVPLEVTGEDIKELSADPGSIQLPVGGVSGLRIFGRADKSGLKEMFAQPDLKATPRKPNVVDTDGDVVKGKAEGDDTIDIAWKSKVKTEVPVKVMANAIAGLDINPKNATISTNSTGGVTYEVTGMRGDQRVILTPNDGVSLNVDNPNVAAVANGTTVISRNAGQTQVVATLGGQKAETTLNVVPGTDVPTTGTTIIGPGGGVIYTDTGVTTIPPSGSVVGVVFKPDLYQAGVQSMPQTVKLLRQYQSGFDDVSNDPNVKITKEANPGIAKVEKVDGGWKITPVGPGLTVVSAMLGDQTAKMNIEINGGDGKPLTGTLVVNPSTISLWSGETVTLSSNPGAVPQVYVDPGGGQAAIAPKSIKITVPDNQSGIVGADGDKLIGRSVGDATVTVTAENGPAASVNVHVTAPEEVTTDPTELNLQPGQSHMASVMAHGVAVPATLESLDKNVIDADPSSPGQFTAKTQGQTQLHAVYHGKEVFAKVSVAGQRFQSVQSTFNPSEKTVTIDVAAAAAEGDLEYRVYEQGATPKENWVRSTAAGDTQKTNIQTEKLDTSKDEVHLVIEARDKAGKSVQQYPLTLIHSYTQQNAPPPGQPQK